MNIVATEKKADEAKVFNKIRQGEKIINIAGGDGKIILHYINNKFVKAEAFEFLK